MYSSKLKLVLDIVASALLGALVIYLIVKEPTEELPGNALGMFLMFYLGLLFACAYVARERLLIFRALSLLSQYLSYPQRRGMALVYSLVFFGIAAFDLVKVLNAG